MTAEERTDYLLGQLHALNGMVQVLLTAHPQRAVLLAAFEEQLLKTEANTLFSSVSESHLQGLRDVQAGFYVAGANPAES